MSEKPGMNSEKIEKLFSLVTEHPGGYKDILQTLAASKAEFNMPNGIKVSASDVVEEIVRTVSAVENPANGMLVTAAQSVLKRYGLPVPGNPKWVKPAEKWFKN